ncbi:MAG: MobF family relaxase [Opitutaceae bacterium]|nr:MobF family relaxase [Opitutaceae bacterium]
MLRSKSQLNLRNAKSYFREHLSAGDYYAEGQKVTGDWFGIGAEKLGLKGSVKEADFLALCEGLHPQTGRRLTARKNTNRNDGEKSVSNRRVFYDFTISPPKSVSVVAYLQDERIFNLHDRAVRQAMNELEKFAATRVRKSAQHGDRNTANVVGASFRHDTSRELDPHLHTHCVLMNATFDGAENRWKALEVQAMYRAQKFAENLYYHELCRGLRALGYDIENNGRDFEIKHVPRTVIDRFSKRHQQIDEDAAKRLAREDRGADVNTVRRRVAHENRRRKIKEATADKLRPSWLQQLTRDEAKALAALKPAKQPGPPAPDVAGIVAWADEHLFERRSVVRDDELMSAALARGRGEAFDLSLLRHAIDQRGYVRQETTGKLTSPEVLRCELEIVIAAHDGRGAHSELNASHRPSASLSAEQKAAVETILQSPDFITLFRGGAGTGKSRTLGEVERGLSAAGHPVVVLAPQRQQVADLKKDGLAAETLARFLQTRQLPRGAVVVVDEAGQIGGRDLRDLIRVVQANAGRLILSGDTRQHGAVAASDALRAIEKHARLKPAVLREIRRQDPALGASAKERGFIRQYRAAVKAAATGDIVGSYDRLDRLGCVRECGGGERRARLADEYLAAVGRNENALVVAQTRDEANAVNETVRTRLRDSGQIKTGKTLPTFQPVDLGEAQKRDPRFYRLGQYACFIQRYGRYAKGELCEIVEANARGLVIIKNGRRSTLSYHYAKRIVVTTRRELEIAPGDRLQLKLNATSREGLPLNNGELVTVHSIAADGVLSVAGAEGKRKTVAPAQCVLVRGYAVTSYGSQGKTVDTVLFSDAANRAATSAEQWYVTISRGRKRVMVFTSDRDELRANVVRVGGRELAMDLQNEITAEAERRQAAEESARVLEAVERTRLHNAHMAIVQQGQKQQVRHRVAV